MGDVMEYLQLYSEQFPSLQEALTVKLVYDGSTDLYSHFEGIGFNVLQPWSDASLKSHICFHGLPWTEYIDSSRKVTFSNGELPDLVLFNWTNSECQPHIDEIEVKLWNENYVLVSTVRHKDDHYQYFKVDLNKKVTGWNDEKIINPKFAGNKFPTVFQKYHVLAIYRKK